jgi:signal transduction histidine kinase/DNA-binding response OmpR family regulator
MKKEPATILIADDNPDIRRLIQVNLKFEGYNVITAENGKQALQLALEHLPDLVVLDVLMPEMDGWQVLSHLKTDKTTKTIPVIMLTGVSMKEGKERGLIEGVEDFLSKPFNPLRLIEIVNEVVSSRRIPEYSDATEHELLKLGVISEGETGLNLIRALSGSNTIKMTAFCDTDSKSASLELSRELGVPTYNNPEDILSAAGLELLIDTREQLDENLRQLAQKNKVEFLQGYSARVMRSLLEEQGASRTKEKSLVRELNTRVKELSMFNEMAQILTTPLDLWLLLDKISQLSLKISRVDACAVLMYDEEQEKFLVSSMLGLNSDFKELLKISLSDLICEELMSIRRALIVDRISDMENISLTRLAQKDGIRSMAVIPLFSKEKLLGIILVFSKAPGKFKTEDVNLLSLMAGQAGVAVENAYLYESTRKKSHLVEKLISKLIQAQEEERKRIAAEIHDTIAQSLVGIYTCIQTCQYLLKKAPEQLEEQLKSLKDVVGDNVNEVRQIMFNLRPSSLDDLGLMPSLENYIKRFEREHGYEVEVMVTNRIRRLHSTVETAVFRIIQEALTNIKKHSQGKKVLIRLSFEPKWVHLLVADDGQGFSWDEVTEKFLRGDSHGLQGMKERVSVLGGTFKVTTEEGKGCMVSATIPATGLQEEEPDIDRKELTVNIKGI